MGLIKSDINVIECDTESIKCEENKASINFRDFFDNWINSN